MTHSHTPGPWHIRNGADFEVYEGGDDPHTVASGELVVAHISRQAGKSNANAHLIAAAPDMLDMLYTVLPYIKTLEQDKGYKPGAVNTISRQIQAAIAKAEGRHE